jgi:hypothetical protein
MSILSIKSSAFILAAAVIGAVSLTSFAASAKPNFPMNKPCIGCNSNTWTPGNHGHHNHWHGGYGGGLSVSFAAPAVADEGDCYFVRRRVFIDGVGVVSKRQMVCN